MQNLEHLVAHPLLKTVCNPWSAFLSCFLSLLPALVSLLPCIILHKAATASGKLCSVQHAGHRPCVTTWIKMTVTLKILSLGALTFHVLNSRVWLAAVFWDTADFRAAASPQEVLLFSIALKTNSVHFLQLL